MGIGNEFADRLEEVMHWTGWSAREWARRAKLTEEGHVNALLRRCRMLDTIKVDVSTIGPLAAAANVTLDWLVTGRGHPTGPLDEFQDPLYPSRGRVVASLKFLDFHQGVAVSILAENGFADDPGLEYWQDRAKLENARISANELKTTGRQKRRRTR